MRIHFIEGNNTHIAFLPDQLRFFEVNRLTRDILTDMMLGRDETHIKSKYGITETDCHELRKIVSGHDNAIYNNRKDDNAVLDKLALNIANDCNLSCKYCYASGGNYGQKSDIMRPDLACKALDIFYSKYKEIGIIQFFGGEPCLNLAAIEKTCLYLEDKCSRGEIADLPAMGVVTNGTLVNDHLIQLINRYRIDVTVSLDGPPRVNNKMRVYKDGGHTFEVIQRNIGILQDKTNRPISVECTYNNCHEEENMGIIDLISFFKKDLGITNVHIVPVTGKPDSDFLLRDRQPFVESIGAIFNSLDLTENSYTLVDRILRRLRNKKTKTCLCGAGLSSFSISTMGDVYPCFLFTGEKAFNLGNIDDPNLFVSKRFVRMTEQLGGFSKINDEMCRDCFNNTICAGCIGANYFETGNIHVSSDVDCEMYKTMTERIILELVKLYNGQNRKVN